MSKYRVVPKPYCDLDYFAVQRRFLRFFWREVADGLGSRLQARNWILRKRKEEAV